MNIETTGVTRLLKAWGEGDSSAFEELAPKVYRELRRMADNYMRHEKPGNTLQATALVHEVFLRIVDASSVDWKDRAHFFAVSATMMRRILADRARARGATKRGGQAVRISLDDAPEVGTGQRDREIVAIDEALNELAEMDPRKARVIELRFFGGLTVEETAEVLKISTQTVIRDWRMARAWLTAELK